MKKNVEHHSGYLRVDCSNPDRHEMAEACRQMAQECITSETNRVLVYADGCDPEGHLPLRNAFTTMLLAGIPSGFRLALVTDVPRVWALFTDLERDLLVLNVLVKAFTRENDAVEWLRLAAPVRAVRAQRQEA